MRISEIAANHSNQFIELHNQSTESIDISGCQLQTNRSETARYVFPNETFINADDYIAVYVNQSGLSLTKTTTGTVYLLSSDGATEVDVKSYENLNEGTSLSLIGGMWRQTFAVTPGANNQYEEFLPCAEGYIRNTETGRCNKRLVATVAKPCLSTQYRSEETGRCRNVTANSSSLKACEPHQYRNPETNRCRNITTSTSTLQPCRANQYRSVETNRCRNVATAATTLKPCAANQERNPETNRCRAKKQSVAADFPIDTVKDSAEATLGWWAFGGVGLLALGYAGWEWRSEVLAVIRKGISVIPTGR